MQFLLHSQGFVCLRESKVYLPHMDTLVFSVPQVRLPRILQANRG